MIPGLFLELGEGFVRKLVGAFAIAVWDPRTRKLTLARDRAGERHLFFTCAGNEIIFATELAAWFRGAGCPSPRSSRLCENTCSSVFSRPRTRRSRKFRKVAPGEMVVLEGTKVRRERYWRWRNRRDAQAAAFAGRLR